MRYLWIIGAGLAAWIIGNLIWRWSSRRYSLPCPVLFSGTLESPLLDRVMRTETTLDRIGFRPGQRVLEFGPGPGRLLVPAAQRVLPGGEAVGLDIQPGMIERLRKRSAKLGVTNVTGIVGDATETTVEAESFDVVFLCTTLGEIPDREAALRQCFAALKPGGLLSDTEVFPDPHYQSMAIVKRLAAGAGFEFQKVHGSWAFYTANFVKPDTGRTAYESCAT